MAAYKKLILLLLATAFLSQTIICEDSNQEEEQAVPEINDEETKQDVQKLIDEEPSPIDNETEEDFQLTQEEFYREYDDHNNQEKPIVIMRQYFPDRSTTLERKVFQDMMIKYIDGTVDDEDHLKHMTAEEHANGHKELTKMVDQYFNTELADKEVFTLQDFYEDFMSGAFYKWFEKNHPAFKENYGVDPDDL
jgi:hypothetical protein